MPAATVPLDADRTEFLAPSGGEHLTADATVGDLSLWQCPIDAATTGRAVERRLAANPDLPGLIVQVSGRTWGLLSRRRFLECMTRPYSRELYHDRAIALLLRTINDEALIFEAAEPVHAATERALSRPIDIAYEPALVRLADGDMRLLGIDVLLRAQSHILALANSAKDELIVEVRRYADQVESTLSQLQQAQERLVQSEKMAALGQLVAGVAHEINTPIGIALTAASHLEEKTRGLIKLFETGSMKRSDLQSFTGASLESAKLVTANINRAAQLIQSFKQVAVDQTSEQRRTFELRSYLGEVLTSLHPEIRKRRHQVDVTCPEDVTVTSYPGALSQIITNLVMNAMLHAYEGDQTGRIEITAKLRGDLVKLRVTDDGRGIPPEIRSKIFDPFFTTKRGEGGTGLGLHIIFNLIEKTLKGRIRCDSEVGRGTMFTVSFPAETPESEPAASHA
jgi:two-component system, NtrC family, sensor kinase